MASTWNSLTGMVKNEAISSFLSMSAENCRTIFETGNAVFMWNWSYAARLFLDEESPVKGRSGLPLCPYPVMVKQGNSQRLCFGNEQQNRPDIGKLGIHAVWQVKNPSS